MKKVFFPLTAALLLLTALLSTGCAFFDAPNDNPAMAISRKIG